MVDISSSSSGIEIFEFIYSTLDAEAPWPMPYIKMVVSLAKERGGGRYEDMAVKALNTLSDHDYDWVVREFNVGGSITSKDANITAWPDSLTVTSFDSAYSLDVVIETRRMVSKVNSDFANLRKRFITDIPGQEMNYITKKEQATRYATMLEEPSTSEGIELIDAEVGITGEDRNQVSQVYLNTGQLLIEINAVLEPRRIHYINEYEACESLSDISLVRQEYENSAEAFENQVSMYGIL